MTELTFDHSDQRWFEKLTCPMEELSPSERDALARHVVSCPDCSHTLTRYARLKRLIQALPAPKFPSGLPPQLRNLWQEEELKSSQPTAPDDLPASGKLVTYDSDKLSESQFGHYVWDTPHREPVSFEQLIKELME